MSNVKHENKDIMPDSQMVYEMCLLFRLSLGLKTVNDIAAACGFSEKLVAENIVTVKLTQTLPIIPTDEMIAEYEKVIKKNYNSEKFTCEVCKFSGYEYIRPIISEQKGT